MAAFSLKIAPKHDTKICYPSIAAVTAEMGGFLFKEAHQITKIGRKGRESGACLLEISTQIAGNSRKW